MEKMKTEERRNRIQEILETSEEPVSGSALAKRFGVSRQVIVTDNTEEQTEDELNAIVELGGKILDVYVDHRIYGTIRRPLEISSRRDVGRFLEDINSSASSPLMNITKGYHFHTVQARSEAVLKEIEEMLRDKGYLIETLPGPVIYDPKEYGKE